MINDFFWRIFLGVGGNYGGFRVLQKLKKKYQTQFKIS
jgi:hypothetical protein